MKPSKTLGASLLIHLRSGNFIKSWDKSVRDLASRISLVEESVSQRAGLETIVEDTSDVWSTTSELIVASQGSHKFVNVDTTIKYNTTLEYHLEKSLRAKIYVDPLGRFAVRIDNQKVEFRQEVPVSLQEDRYMNPYATMY